MNKRPFVVGFEGVDGSGKTTHAKLLEEGLRSQGYSVRRVKETEDTHFGRLAHGLENNRNNWQRYIAFIASKAELAEMVSRFTEDFVLLDRFTPSVFAYAPDFVRNDLALHYAIRRLLKSGIRFPKVDVCVLMRSNYTDTREDGSGKHMSEEEFREIDRLYHRATHGCAVWKLEVDTSRNTLEKTHKLIMDFVLNKYRKLSNQGGGSCQQ